MSCSQCVEIGQMKSLMDARLGEHLKKVEAIAKREREKDENVIDSSKVHPKRKLPYFQKKLTVLRSWTVMETWKSKY